MQNLVHFSLAWAREMAAAMVPGVHGQVTDARWLRRLR